MIPVPLWMRLEICLDWRRFWHCVRLVCEFAREHGVRWSIWIAWLMFWDLGYWQPVGYGLGRPAETWQEKWREYREWPTPAGEEKP